MYADKRKARKKQWRIPEATLMTIAALAALAGLIYLTVRKNQYADTNVRIGV